MDIDFRLRKLVQPKNNTRNGKNFSGGFTLIEIIVVVVILLVLVLIVARSFFAFRDTSLLNTTTDNIVSLIGEARNATFSARADSVYGIRIATSSVTLFQGSTYVPGAATNKVITLDGRLTATTTVSGARIVFTRLTGATTNTGTTTISLVSDSTKYRTIFVGGGGTIERN